MEFLVAITALMLAVIPLAICSIEAFNAKKLSELALMNSTRNITINSLSYFWQLKLDGTNNVEQKAQYLRDAAESHQSLTDILSSEEEMMVSVNSSLPQLTSDD